MSIPQVNPTLKQLAIDSLAAYSAACRYFLVLAPDAVHADTLQPCDEHSYSRRGWCRLEQWANAISGFTGMFVYGTSRRLEPCAATAHDATSMIQDAVFVFEGEFSVAADRLKIVDTVLGLWSIALAHKGEFYELVARERERALPRQFCGELPSLVEREMQGELASEVAKRKLVKRVSSPRVGGSTAGVRIAGEEGVSAEGSLGDGGIFRGWNGLHGLACTIQRGCGRIGSKGM